jgi:predicted RNase H-like nuclease (RuvC/YqgF family)
LIVGIDPGTTKALAILDLKGDILSISSKRDMRKSELIKTILKHGHPVVIASDVSPSPQLVQKLSSIFGCKLFIPDKKFSVSDKQEVTKKFFNQMKNEHELDALAASLKAWKKYRELFNKVYHTLQKLGMLSLFEDVVKELLVEDSENIEHAINKVLKSKRMKNL